MENNGSFPPQVVNTVRLIFLALIAGCIMFAAVTLMTDANREMQDPTTYLVVGITIALIGIFGVYFFTLKKTPSPAQWTTNHIMGYAMVEGATMVNLVFFFMGGNSLFLYVAGASLLALISRYPRNPGSSGEGQDLRSPGSFES